jgi:hypothetical protein
MLKQQPRMDPNHQSTDLFICLFFVFCLFFFGVGLEPMASGKHSTTELHPGLFSLIYSTPKTFFLESPSIILAIYSDTV